MKIEDLLNKYFDGDTSREEERELKRFFSKENVPPALEIYRPIFGFLAEETKQQTVKDVKPKRYFLYSLSSVAAGLLIILSIAGIKEINRPDNYIIVDGQRSTNIQLAREQAKAAFNDVSFTREDIFEALFSE